MNLSLSPHPWSHHHIQRLFHISLLLTTVVIIGAFIANLTFILLPSNADDGSITQTVTLVATVSGISSGPLSTDNPGSGGSAVNAPFVQPQKDVTATPTTDNQSQLNTPIVIAPFSGQSSSTREFKIGKITKAIPVFETNKPRFVGSTNIPFANVTMSMVADTFISGTAHADAKGNFIWESSPLQRPGVYTITVKASNPQISNEQTTGEYTFFADFISPNSVNGSNPSQVAQFLPPAFTGQTLFDVFATIGTNDKHVQAGQSIAVNLQLLDLSGLNKQIDVPLEFIIEDSSGNIVLQSSETVAVQGKKSLNKIFYTAPNTAPGQYLVLVEVPSQKSYAVGSDTFIVDPPLPVGATTTSTTPQIASSVPTLTAQASVGLVLFFLFVAYFEYHNIRLLSNHIRFVRENDLRKNII